MKTKTLMKQKEHTRKIKTKRGKKKILINRGNKKKELTEQQIKAIKSLGFDKIGAPMSGYSYPLKKGFLLPYLMAHDYQTNKRWYFWGVSMINLRIPKKIPQIDFDNQPNPEAMKMLKKNIKYHKSVSGHHGSRAIEDFIDWILWGFGSKLIKEAPKIPEKTNKYWYENFKLRKLLERPTDYMAALLQEFGVRGGPGWFATPMNMCYMISEMTRSKNPKPWESVHDPCVGTGSMLMPASNYSINMYAQDISGLMIKALSINAYLYIPWLVKPFPPFMLEKLKKDITRNPNAKLKPSNTPMKIPIKQMNALTNK